MAKETPTDPGRLGRSVQDIAEPVIPGPCKQREPLVEIASPYHIEALEENTGDTTERPSQPAAPHSPLKHSDSETDASVVSQPSAGAGVDTDILTDMHPRFASSSSASTNRERGRGGVGDDENGDGTHERGREWEREHARRAE